jgi:Cdc6-like AAA superfamily ATPase
MIRNAMREFGSEDDFVGHLGPEDFLIITSPEAAAQVRDRLAARVEQSREYFYPLRDRQRIRENVDSDYLRLSSAIVTAEDGPFESTEDLRRALGYLPATTDS